MICVGRLFDRIFWLGLCLNFLEREVFDYWLG